MSSRYIRAAATIAGIAAFTLSVAAWADREGEHRGEDHGNHGQSGQPAPVNRVYDTRYNHDHYYLPHGHQVAYVPHGAVSLHYGGSPYYFHGGIWYRPYGYHYAVVAPPFGLVVPFLPPFYTTIWVHGAPYYYANDVYYAWHSDEHGYVVTRPPNEAEVSTDAHVNNDLFIYPKNGQSEQQQSTDRFECHSWANKETSYDPSLPGGGVQDKEANDKRASYFRAMTACLEGRGYSVK
jgi:hypothetical protein